MVGYDQWTKKTVLITVRTYPVPSRTSIEVSCTAGITDDGRWIRLFPVPYRFLAQDKRFRKYQWIEAEVIKSLSDNRPESYKINVDSINILSGPIPSTNHWEQRKAKVFPLKNSSLCWLQNERNRNKEPTLGFFKPKTIVGFRIEPTDSQWTDAQLTNLRQYPLFGNAPGAQLEKIPFVFSYEFKCEDPECPTHTLQCTDWEIGASYRAWKDKYGTRWETKFRDRYETDMILKNDTHFFVGTVRSHPDAWIIVGLFYPQQ